ncbi:MAG: hypothetical protein A2498_10470 [Lentisphaerae bacterium RIFOXYC12_FULL_60_16]|nr:MAG: hypothetical protein A2498_10470 [Lentisphaerae bacterium RIFOXYC12_FULL_60_16]OGV83488.1 MAG: hypothetical protein A2340_01930 [Lentisphaerae bacterium RIFOXYB12_FULL_60_10]
MAEQPDEARLLAVAVSAARAGGLHALTNWSRRHEVIMRAPHDIKLQLDVECQQKAESVIRRAFPEHLVLGEEAAGTDERNAGSSDYRWIIDPIDGTVNFSHGLPFWCTSIAVEYRGDVLAGAVFGPALDHLFTATRSTPASLNGQPIRVSQTTDLPQAMIATGIDRGSNLGIPPLAMFNRITSVIQKARVFGSAALDLCRVASGHVDGYFEAGIFIWDVAAAGLIVRQAGGRTETLGVPQGHCLRFMGSNGHIHDALRTVVDVTRFD